MFDPYKGPPELDAQPWREVTDAGVPHLQEQTVVLDLTEDSGGRDPVTILDHVSLTPMRVYGKVTYSRRRRMLASGAWQPSPVMIVAWEHSKPLEAVKE